MNIIDNKFNKLMEMLRNFSKEQLFNHILIGYKSLPIFYQNSLKDYFDKFDYWGKIDLLNENYDYFNKKADDIFNNLNNIEKVYNMLNDYSSKYIFYSILNNWVNYDMQSLKLAMNNKYKHYFDLDIIPNCENEVFVDVGGFTGDTTLDYINTYGENSFKKIYIYEITKQNFDVIKNNLKNYENIEIKNKALKDKKGFINIDESLVDSSANRTKSDDFGSVECVSLDEDINEKLTMIKMDIEGDEIDALNGAKNTIIKNTPKLLISVYHKNTHLWEIPLLINNLNKNYNYYLRYYGGYVYPTEVVLIATPKNKKEQI